MLNKELIFLMAKHNLNVLDVQMMLGVSNRSVYSWLGPDDKGHSRNIPVTYIRTLKFALKEKEAFIREKANEYIIRINALHSCTQKDREDAVLYGERRYKEELIKANGLKKDTPIFKDMRLKMHRKKRSKVK